MMITVLRSVKMILAIGLEEIWPKIVETAVMIASVLTKL
jgi:hypothetical protein